MRIQGDGIQNYQRTLSEMPQADGDASEGKKRPLYASADIKRSFQLSRQDVPKKVQVSIKGMCSVILKNSRKRPTSR